jgi:aminotransferase
MSNQAKQQFISKKANQFQESVIREMTRSAVKIGAVNLGQGVPDFPCAPELKEAGVKAILDDINQYAITFGDKNLREALSEKYSPVLGYSIDPETEITVTCGTTEALMATLLALVDPGEEVIVFEPYYENYLPQTILAGAVMRHVPLKAPRWQFDPEELAAVFNNKTRAIILNTPHNPTGKIFTAAEIKMIGELCQKWGAYIITDEIYEHMVYDGAIHTYPASLPEFRDLTITITGLSKTYSLTGWRIGWAIANRHITTAIRKVHDFLAIGAAAPLQRAAIQGIKLHSSFYLELAQQYAIKRQYMMETLDKIEMPYIKPQGAYYIFSDVAKYNYVSDIEFDKFMIDKVGVAVIPGSTFFSSKSRKAHAFVRFCFSRKQETLEAARERLWQAKF